MVQDSELSGVELLALYGEDGRELGSWFSKAKKAAKKAVKYTPQGAIYNAVKRGKKRRLHGEDYRVGYSRIDGDGEELGAFLPGLKKIGKFTHKITGGIAKAIIPASLVDAAAALDPTKKGKSKAVVPVPAKQVITVPKTIAGIDTKKVLIIGGAGIGSLILLKVLLSSSRR